MDFLRTASVNESPLTDGRLFRCVRSGGRFKIVLTFGRTVGDEDAIFDTGLKRFGGHAHDFVFHAGNVTAIIKGLGYWDGVGVGDQMPERQTIFIGLPFVQRDDFEFLEFVRPA